MSESSAEKDQIWSFFRLVTLHGGLTISVLVGTNIEYFHAVAVLIPPAFLLNMTLNDLSDHLN